MKGVAASHAVQAVSEPEVHIEQVEWHGSQSFVKLE
jgi:hypothetical protein